MALRTDLMIGLPFRVLRESRTISWTHDMSPLQSVGYKTPLVKSFREAFSWAGHSQGFYGIFRSLMARPRQDSSRDTVYKVFP